MHDHRHPAFDPIDDLLGDFLALVDFHHHALAVGAQGEKSMNTGIEVKIDDRVGGFMIDGAAMLKRHRHRHQDAFDWSIACHNRSFRFANCTGFVAIHSASDF